MKADEAGTDRPAFRVSILAIMVFQTCALFARSAFDTSLVRNGMDRSVANDVSYLVVPPLLLVLLFPYLREHAASLLRLLRLSRLSLRLCWMSLLLGLVLRATYWSVLTILMWTGVVRNDEPGAIAGPFFGFGCPPPAVLALSLLVMSVLVPMMEEIINRGFVLHALLPRGVATSVIASACLFALAHKPGAYVVALVSGVFLATQMLNARTLWAPLLTHAAYNAAAIIHWDCFQLIWNPPPADPGLAAAGKAAVPFAIAGIWLSCWLVSEKAIGAGSSRSPNAPA
jgi:membrane protease YdiL (CAAX protease family)